MGTILDSRYFFSSIATTFLVCFNLEKNFLQLGIRSYNQRANLHFLGGLKVINVLTLRCCAHVKHICIIILILYVLTFFVFDPNLATLRHQCN